MPNHPSHFLAAFMLVAVLGLGGLLAAWSVGAVNGRCHAGMPGACRSAALTRVEAENSISAKAPASSQMAPQATLRLHSF